jgi:chlorobactene glucosyltransferase
MREVLLLIGVFMEWVIVPLLGLCLVHALINMRLLRRLSPSRVASKGASGDSISDVSVLIPARNEEACIRECLASLASQQPPVREVILLDDRSTDRTAEIARELGFREEKGSRLRLIHGAELPEGWVGKNWACHQLSRAADQQSTHLLFTDADTIHGSGCVATALAHARSVRADLLSLWPDQITGTWSEKLVIPLGYLLFMAFHPFPLLGWLQADPARARRWGFDRRRLAGLGAANGQFLMFRRTTYEALGGHEALRDHLVEDIAFGRRVASRTGEGMRLVNADGIGLLKCRMYTGFDGVWEGFSKNLRPVFEESHLSFILFGVVIFCLFLLPFLLLPWMVSAWIAVGLLLLTRCILTLYFRTSWLGFIVHPAAVLLALMIAFNSWRLCLRRGIVWKDRVYSGATRSVID